MPEHFFFYGTLIPEFAPLHLRDKLAELQFVADGSAHGTLYDLGAYPGAVFDETSPTIVFGRIFQAPAADRILAALDRYEGYDPTSAEGSEYIRRRLPIALEDGATIDCWVYEYNGSLAAASIIPAGRYIARKPLNSSLT
jgi:gamma-glutamylcyclotransferase (GGCT)/AIG2-like uncharacterized protein YtfP